MNTEKVLNDKLAEFVQLEKQRRELEAQLQAVKAKAEKLQEKLLDEWANRGQQNAKLDGLIVYLAHDFYCNKKPGVRTQDICEALQACGLAQMVAPNYSASSLKAWVKEQRKADSDLPSALDALLNYDEIPRLRTRRT